MKTLFEVLDYINKEDVKNNTGYVSVCNEIVSAQTTKKGGHVTMGIPEISVKNLMTGKQQCLLVIIDWDEYKRVDAILNPK